RAQSPEPRAQSPEPRAQSPEPRAQSPEPRAQKGSNARARILPQPPAPSLQPRESALSRALRVDEDAAIASLVLRRIQGIIGETDDGVVGRRDARVLRRRADADTHPRRLWRCRMCDLQRVNLAHDARCD